MTIEIRDKVVYEPLTVVGYYRPPYYRNAPRFLAHLEGVLDLYVSDRCLIVGDVNFDLLGRVDGPRSSASSYVNLLSSFDFFVCNDRVTRKIKGTLLDHVVDNFSDKVPVASATIDVEFSDHSAVLTRLPFPVQRGYVEMNKKRTDFSLMRTLLSQKLSEVPRDDRCDVDRYMEKLVTACNWAYERSTVNEVKRFCRDKRHCPWMNSHLLAIVRDNIDLYRKTRRPVNRDDEALRSKLRLSNANVAKWQRFYERKYYENMFAEADNPKSVWRRINTVLGRSRKRCVISELNHDGKKLLDDVSKATALNIFFTEIGKKIAERFKSADLNKYGTLRSSVNTIFLEPVVECEVFQIIRQLDSCKSPGIDGITVEMIKECACVIVPVLTEISNITIFRVQSILTASKLLW